MQLLISILATLFLGMIVFLINFLATFYNTDLFSVGDIVLLLTAGILLVYTYETYRLRCEAQKQTSFEMRPFIRLQLDSYLESIDIVNEGRGIAIHMKLQIYYKNEKLKAVFKRELIAPGARNKTSIDMEELGEEWDMICKDMKKVRTNFTDIFNQNKNITDVEVEFQDIEENKYSAYFKYSNKINDRFRIVTQKRVGKR